MYKILDLIEDRYNYIDDLGEAKEFIDGIFNELITISNIEDRDKIIDEYELYCQDIHDNIEDENLRKNNPYKYYGVKESYFN